MIDLVLLNLRELFVEEMLIIFKDFEPSSAKWTLYNIMHFWILTCLLIWMNLTLMWICVLWAMVAITDSVRLLTMQHGLSNATRLFPQPSWPNHGCSRPSSSFLAIFVSGPPSSIAVVAGNGEAHGWIPRWLWRSCSWISPSRSFSQHSCKHDEFGTARQQRLNMNNLP